MSESSFRRPLRALFMASCLSLLAACGGGGGGGGGTSAGPGASKLFVADAGNLAIGSFANPNPSAGAIPIDRIIMGDRTNLNSGMAALALDAAANRLYVGNGTTIVAFDSASTAEGNITPIRVASEGGSAGGVKSLHLDKASDVLYAGTGFGLLTFTGISTARNAVPARRLTGNFFFNHGAAVDTVRNIAYLLSTEAGESELQYGSAYTVRVYDGASTLDGNVPPNRVINLNTQISDCGLWVDATNDRLYVATLGGRINVYELASQRSGPAVPNRVIQLPVSTSSRLAYNAAADRLYAVSPGALFIIPTASTSDGPVAATALQAPQNGQLTGVAVAP